MSKSNEWDEWAAGRGKAVTGRRRGRPAEQTKNFSSILPFSDLSNNFAVHAAKTVVRNIGGSSY